MLKRKNCLLNDFDVGEKFRADKIIDEEMIFVYCLQTQKREKKKSLQKKYKLQKKRHQKMFVQKCQGGVGV